MVHAYHDVPGTLRGSLESRRLPATWHTHDADAALQAAVAIRSIIRRGHMGDVLTLDHTVTDAGHTLTLDRKKSA